METAPGDPGDGLTSAGGNAQLIGRGLVVGFNLAAELNTDGRNILEAGAVGCPDAECVAVDADVRPTSDAGSEFTKLRTAQDVQDLIQIGEGGLQDLNGLGFVAGERADLGEHGGTAAYTAQECRGRDQRWCGAWQYDARPML